MPPDQEFLAELAALRAELAGLRAIVTSLEKENSTLSENQFIQLRLIKQLQEAVRKRAQPLQKDRADMLRALLADNGGKMLAKDARQKMHLTKSRFSELLTICDFLETKPLHTDRRKTVIILKSELVPRNY